MPTVAAIRSIPLDIMNAGDTVFSLRDRRSGGWMHARAQVNARRWQRIGRALIAHNGHLSDQERWHAALLNAGSRAVLTSFTGVQAQGLTGWTRPEVHVLVPGGTHVPRLPELDLRIHFLADWTSVQLVPSRRLHALSPALLRAAASLSPRPAVGILAAAVQQRLTSAERLTASLASSPRLKHRALLIACCQDIGQGAQALSEIDFVRLCERHGLPTPTLQAVREERSGRRRYLDAAWTLPNGSTVAAEVDGAMHLRPTQWYSDQLRQNELVIAGTTLLRYPSVVVRTEEQLVADQLRRALIG